MHTKNTDILRKIYHLLEKRQKLSFFVIILIMIVSAGLSQVVPLTVGTLTDHVLQAGNISFFSIVPYLLFILIASIINEVIKIIRRLIVEDTCTRTEKNARVNAVKSLLKAPLSYFRLNMRGNIHGMLNRSLEGTTKVLKLLFMDFCPSIFSSIAAIIVVFARLPWILAVIMILVVPVGTFIVLRQITTQQGIRVDLVKSKAGMDGAIVELLNGVETVRIYNSVDLECGRCQDTSEKLRQKEMRHHKAMAMYDCFKFINEAVFTVLIIGLSVYLAARREISIGSVLTAYLCFTQLTSPLRELHRILDELSESMVLAEQYFLLANIPEDFSYQTADHPPVSHENTPYILKADHIAFSYPEAPDTVILRDFTLNIRAGEFLGIAGPSGCGKSSLIKTFARLEQISAGHLTLDGQDISGLSRKDIRRVISLVPQTPFLIAGSIFENIAYGMEEKPPLAEVKEAARRACIHNDIEKLPGGYDFLLAESGSNLSGGQRQRIALARIFLQRPKLLILDEATSALDNTSERFIQAEIEKLILEAGTTVVSIAHRLSTLQNCDRILVMDSGSVVQEGTYADLIDREGMFRDMYLGILK